MDRTQGEERSMTVDLAEALAKGSIATDNNGSTLDITLDVEKTNILHKEALAVDLGEDEAADTKSKVTAVGASIEENKENYEQYSMSSHHPCTRISQNVETTNVNQISRQMVHGSIFLTEYSLINMARQGMDINLSKAITSLTNGSMLGSKPRDDLQIREDRVIGAKYIKNFILEGSTNSKLFCGKFNGENIQTMETKQNAILNVDLAEDLDKNNKSNTLEITLDVELSTDALESNEKEFSAEALVSLMMLINLIHQISKKMDRTQGEERSMTVDLAEANEKEFSAEALISKKMDRTQGEERSMTVDPAEALAKGSIATANNGYTLDITLDVGKTAIDAEEFQQLEKNERKDSEENIKTNEDRLEKTMEDVKLEKEKQNEEGVQEESKSSEETNKDKVCTDLHWRTAAKNDLIVSVLLLKHKTIRQITKWYGNAQEKDLYKSDQNKTDEAGQKIRQEKNTRCTWEPGLYGWNSRYL